MSARLFRSRRRGIVSLSGWQQRPRRELVVAGLVEPCTSDIRESEAGHEAGQRESVNPKLRDGLVRAGVGLVVEDMDRAVARLQEIDVARDESRLMTKRRAGAVDRFFGNDCDAVYMFKRRDIVFEEKNRNFDGDSRAVVDQHEALKPRMAVVVGADARNDQRRRVGGGVLLFDNHEAVEGEKVRRQLRAARAVFAAKKLVRAIAVHAFEKMCERGETGVASAAVVESSGAHEGKLGAVEGKFVDLAMIELDRADELRRREKREAAIAQPAVCREAGVRGKPARDSRRIDVMAVTRGEATAGFFKGITAIVCRERV